MQENGRLFLMCSLMNETNVNICKYFALKRKNLVNIRLKAHKIDSFIWKFRFKTLSLHSKSRHNRDFKRNDGTFSTSRLTTSIKVQISRERRRDRTSKTSKENATQLARLQKRKRQRSL